MADEEFEIGDHVMPKLSGRVGTIIHVGTENGEPVARIRFSTSYGATSEQQYAQSALRKVPTDEDEADVNDDTASSKPSLSDDEALLRLIQHCHEQLDETLSRMPRNPVLTGLVRILEDAIKNTNARIDYLKAEQLTFNSLLFALLLHTSYNNPESAKRILELAKRYLHETEPDNETAVLKMSQIGDLMHKAMP